MIDGLIGGKVHGKPVQRAGQSGKLFVTTPPRVATGGDTLFVSVIAFAGSACATLLALDEGDSSSVAGTLTPKVWADMEGTAHPALGMVGATAMTAYHVRLKRQAVQEGQS